MLQSLQRKSVQQQIVLETSEKQKVEDIQNTERTNAMEDLEMWKSRHAIKEEGASVLSGEGSYVTFPIFILVIQPLQFHN